MRKKIVLSGIILMLMLFSAGVGAYAASKLTLIVNGTVAKVDPKVIDGVTYVPVRAAGELLGAKVTYDSKSKIVTVTSEGSTAPASVFTAEEFVFTQFEATNSSFGWDVDVDVTNKGTKTMTANFTASFYDAGGKRIGTAVGSVSDLAKDGTKTTTMVTMDDLTGWKTVKFQIDVKF